MKKITALIISVSLIFSSISHVFAADNYRDQYSSGFLENLLELNYGPEQFELENVTIDSIYLSNSENRENLKQTQIYHDEVNNAIIQAYKNKIINSNQLNALTSSQTKFAYHADQYFYYLRQIELYPYQSYREAKVYMLKSYKNMRIYLRKTKRILAIAQKW